MTGTEAIALLKGCGLDPVYMMDGGGITGSGWLNIQERFYFTISPYQEAHGFDGILAYASVREIFHSRYLADVVNWVIARFKQAAQQYPYEVLAEVVVARYRT